MPLVKLADLWSRQSKKGNKYLGGKMGQAPVLIFPNKNKNNNPDAPTHTLYFSSPDATTMPPNRDAEDQEERPVETSQQPKADDEAPF